LIKAVHPTWTPIQIKSALMMTAFNGGTKENGITPWLPDDVGNGRVDLTKAALAGLIMDESFDNFLAADPSTGGDPKTLNLPSMRNTSCNIVCTWKRTVTSSLGASATWNVAAQNPAGVAITVSPSSFTIAPGQSRTLTITATLNQAQAGIAFGGITLTPSGLPAVPVARMPVAVSGTGDRIFANGFE
jgi:Fibronectin type-III domain